MSSVQDKKKRTALVIDSDPARVDKLQDLLAKRHFTIIAAATYDDAAHILKERREVAVIVLAVKRPDLDPEKIIKNLKANTIKRIPVIVIVEEFVEDIVASALKAGADDFISGPLDSEDLARRIEVQLRLIEGDGTIPKPRHANEKPLGADDAGLFFTSKDGKLLECNNALVEILGYDSKDELLHCNVEEAIYLNPEERSAFRDAIEKKRSGKRF